jgi:hypothetical protein
MKFWITTDDLISEIFIDDFARKKVEDYAKQRANFIDNQMLKLWVNKDNVKSYWLDIQYDIEWNETFTLYRKEAVGNFQILKTDYKII